MSHVFCQQIEIDELEAIKITHPLFSATLLLQGAQLIEFCPNSNQNKNLLWLSESAEYKLGSPIRGGIPICWPWFGNLDKNPTVIQSQIRNPDSASAHGFARSMPWQVKDIHEDCHFVEITLVLTSSEQSKALWPYEFNLEAKFTFSKKLALTLTTTNNDTHPFSISQALHTYLPTDNIEQSYIHTTSHLNYIDALDNWKTKQQQGRIGFYEETDRLYFFNENNYSLKLESPGKSLQINNKHSQSAVIWNPWIEKSKRLSQFGSSDFQKMLCIETANVLSDIKNLPAGGQAELSVEFIANG
jgi:glucose-6-phosphate 1-epimerase